MMGLQKIVTVTLNPCVDKTIEIDSLNRGGLNRVKKTRTDYSGKGVNVSKALHALGCDTVCAGIVFSGGGGAFMKSLGDDGIANDFYLIDGELRTNTKLFEINERTMTEFNERGSFNAPEKLEEIIGKIVGICESAQSAVLAGSIPDGMPPDIYKKIIERLPGVKIILDADGAVFDEALDAGPYAIKPNLFELEAAAGKKLSTHGEIFAACEKIIGAGKAKIVLVSMGSDGAVICGGGEKYYAPSLDIAVRGLQGAGDSMVAGICYAISFGCSVRETLRCAAAAAAASIIREGTLLCLREDFDRFYNMVKISSINA